MESGEWGEPDPDEDDEDEDELEKGHLPHLLSRHPETRAPARDRAYRSRNSTFIIGRDGHVSEVATAAHAVPNRRESPTGARQSAQSG